MRAVIVGAGVAGLAAAHRLAREGAEVVVLEASERIGGMVAPLTIAGKVIDGGAEAYARRLGIADELCATLGLEVAAPTGGPHIRWSATRSWPGADGVLGIPADPDDPALTAALDGTDLATALAEPGLGDEIGAGAATVGELVTARLGRAVTDRLVAPVTRTVYRMEPDQMPLAQFAPGLRGPGSLYAKVAAARGSRSAVAQPIGGLIRLVEALASDIRGNGGKIRLGARVTGIGCDATVTAGGDRLEADRVILACPARPAAELLGGLGITASAPATGTSLNAVLALEPGPLAGAPVGSGVMLGQPIPGLGARALTHYSAKWPWSRGGVELIRLSYAPDANPTREQALADARLLLGCENLVLRDHALVRWPAVPRVLPATERAGLLESLPTNIKVAGAWVAGNGIEAAIASGLEAAA